MDKPTKLGQKIKAEDGNHASDGISYVWLYNFLFTFHRRMAVLCRTVDDEFFLKIKF